MKNEVQNTFATLQRSAVAAVLCAMVLAVSLAGCGTLNGDDDGPKTLKGTKWKATGFLNVETGEFREIEPGAWLESRGEDCAECFTITFNSDSTFSSLSPLNALFGGFKIVYNKSMSQPELNKTFSQIDVSGEYDIESVTGLIHMLYFGGTKMGYVYGDGPLWWKIFQTPVLPFSFEKNQLKLFYNDNQDYLILIPLK